MEREERDVELAGAEPLDQLLVGVELSDPVAAFAEGVGDPLTRAQRDLALERQATGDDRDRAVERYGTPPQPAGRPWSLSGASSGRPPSARARASSSSITLARRRTPSRIRSGGGKQYDSRMQEDPWPSA